MATELEGVTLPVRPDARDFGPELERQVTPQLQRTVSGWNRLLRQGLAAAGIFGGMTELRRSVNMASDLNENLNVARLTFREATKEAIEFADAAASGLGMVSSEALRSQANLGGMLKNMGFMATEAQAMSERLVTLAADMGSAFNAQTPEVIGAISAGIRGETEPLRRFNVFLNQTAIVEEALAKGLIKTRSELDANARAQAALSLLFKQTNDVAGDFGNTLDESLPNQLKVMRAELDGARVALGQELLPEVLDLVQTFRSEGIPAIRDFADALGPALSSGLSLSLPLLKAAGPILQSIADALNAIPTPVLTALGTGWMMNRYANNGMLGMLLPGFAASRIGGGGLGVPAGAASAAGAFAPTVAAALGAHTDDLVAATRASATAATEVAAVERMAATTRISALRRTAVAATTTAAATEATAAAAQRTAGAAAAGAGMIPAGQLGLFGGEIAPIYTQGAFDLDGLGTIPTGITPPPPTLTMRQRIADAWRMSPASAYMGRYGAPAAVLGGAMLSSYGGESPYMQAASSGLMFGGMAAMTPLAGMLGGALPALGIVGGAAAVATYYQNRNRQASLDQESAAGDISKLLQPYADELNALPLEQRSIRIAQILSEGNAFGGSYWNDYRGAGARGLVGMAFDTDPVTMLDVDRQRLDAITSGAAAAGVRTEALTPEDRFLGTDPSADMLDLILGRTSDRTKASAISALSDNWIAQADEESMSKIVDAVVGNEAAYAAAADRLGEAFSAAWERKVAGTGAQMVADWQAEVEGALGEISLGDSAIGALRGFVEMPSAITYKDAEGEEQTRSFGELLDNVDAITPEIRERMGEAFNFADSWFNTEQESALVARLDEMRDVALAKVNEAAAAFDEAAPEDKLAAWFDWQAAITSANEFKDTTLTNLTTLGVEGIDVLAGRWQTLVDAPAAELQVFLTGSVDPAWALALASARENLDAIAGSAVLDERWSGYARMVAVRSALMATDEFLSDMATARNPGSAEMPSGRSVYNAATGTYYVDPANMPETSSYGRITDSPTLSWLSEYGQREVVLPLDKEDRAMELLAQSGFLPKILDRYGRYGSAASAAPASMASGRNVTIAGPVTVVTARPDEWIDDLETMTV